MKKRSLLCMVCVVAVSLVIVALMRAQSGAGAGAASAVPQLPFHLVENFFHYPAHSVVSRISGIAVSPTGNILALNRGYHPVLEFKSDGTFVRSWGEGSEMFVGAHALRFDPQGKFVVRGCRGRHHLPL